MMRFDRDVFSAVQIAIKPTQIPDATGHNRRSHELWLVVVVMLPHDRFDLFEVFERGFDETDPFLRRFDCALPAIAAHDGTRDLDTGRPPVFNQCCRDFLEHLRVIAGRCHHNWSEFAAHRFAS